MQKAERRRQNGRTFDASLACALALLLPSQLANADGGTLRLSQRFGEFQVSVFTSPAAPCVGSIDVSVLVQDAATGQIRDDVPVSVRLQSMELPALVLEQSASVSAATNKLFRAAVMDIPDRGRWRGEILIAARSPTVPAGERNSPTLAFDFEVAEPAAHWLSVAPWVGWPVGIIALFLGHQCLVANSARKHSFRPANNGLSKLR
jgi:hypothetical protein